MTQDVEMGLLGAKMWAVDYWGIGTLMWDWLFLLQ